MLNNMTKEKPKQKRVYRNTKRWYEQQKRKKYIKIGIYTLITSLLIGVSVWNHYHLESQKKLENIIKEINSNVHIVETVEAKTIEVVKTPQEVDKEMKELIVKIIEETNFKWPAYLKRLINCENKRHKGDLLDPLRTNTKGNYPSYSIDRGLTMINTYWHKEVTDEQAFNPDFSIRWTINMINKGRQTEWSCNKKVLANPSYYDNF